MDKSVTAPPVTYISYIDEKDVDLEIEKTCIICFADLLEKNVAILACGHFFHYDCIRNWLIKKEKCPICRGSEEIIQIIENKKPNLIDENDCFNNCKKICCIIL